ncbi:MAG: hypothetical protein LBQ33_00860 [Oscillospiraceae bacterium]|jgi:hypothetical protein|nr:hypothetical protein [Oscillospiraceae bacterium]
MKRPRRVCALFCVFALAALLFACGKAAGGTTEASRSAGAPGETAQTTQNATTGAAPPVSNDWDRFPQPDARRPYDLYPPGDPAQNETTVIYGNVQLGRIAWPVGRIPAMTPVAASFIDRIDEGAENGLRFQSIYVMEMPYIVFRSYVERLRAAGFADETAVLPQTEPVGGSALFVGTLGKLKATALWESKEKPGFDANFRLRLEAPEDA